MHCHICGSERLERIDVALVQCMNCGNLFDPAVHRANSPNWRNKPMSKIDIAIWTLVVIVACLAAGFFLHWPF